MSTKFTATTELAINNTRRTLHVNLMLNNISRTYVRTTKAQFTLHEKLPKH